MAAAIVHVGPIKAVTPEPVDFPSLARNIVGQQLSGKAADTIWRRVVEGLGAERPTPDDFLRRTPEDLRVFGLSRAKAASILDLAARDIPYDRLPRMSDDEVIATLVPVRGIGVWTVQMLLIFSLDRPDVMPTTDLGVRHGVRILDGLADPPTPADVLTRSEVWAPHRSTAARILWRLKDGDIPFPR